MNTECQLVFNPTLSHFATMFLGRTITYLVRRGTVYRAAFVDDFGRTQVINHDLWWI